MREDEIGYVLSYIKRVAVYLCYPFLSYNSSNIQTETEKKLLLYLFEYAHKIEYVDIFSSNLPDALKFIDDIKKTRLFLSIEENSVYFIHIIYDTILDNIKYFREFDRNLCKDYIVKVYLCVKSINESKLKTIEELCKKTFLNYIYEFIIETENEYQCAENYIEKCKIDRYSWKVKSNGDNIDFFKKFVFLNEEDILTKKTSAYEIDKNKTLNDNFFGKISLLPDAKIYSYYPQEVKSELNSLSISKMIKKEINDNAGLWMLTRDKVFPCKKCMYKFLCPPISEYELELNRYNLCNLLKI